MENNGPFFGNQGHLVTSIQTQPPNHQNKKSTPPKATFQVQYEMFTVTWTLSFIVPLSYYTAMHIAIHGVCEALHSLKFHLQVIFRTAGVTNQTSLKGTFVKLLEFESGLCKTWMSHVSPRGEAGHHSHLTATRQQGNCG